MRQKTRNQEEFELWLDAHLGEFREYLEMNHKAVNTIRAYVYAIRQFYENYQEMTENSLQIYKLYLVEHYKPQTVNLRIRALNSYLEYIGNTEIRIPMIRVQQKLYLENVISEADYEYMKRCLMRDGEWLYYFLIRYMAATGMRVSEVTKVTVEDVRVGQKDLYSKDNKVRRIYIPKCLKEDTLGWLKRENRESGPVFLNQNREVITAAGIRGQLKKFAALYGISETVVYPHSFRHRFAKSFIERCGDISMLSDLLGHESIETTRIYLRRTSTEQQQIVNHVVDW
ncbi:MAG: tyrosine-type recombinase/integrase [bacterium]|nr:tyrosine-type recombinase/integrase [bacterium]